MSPFVKEAAPVVPSTSWSGIIGPAVGRSDDFYALGYCPDQDEEEKEKDPGHREYTYIFHFVKKVRTTVGRLSVRLDDLWQQPGGPILAVGVPAGLIQIDAAGLKEIAVPQFDEVATSIWGPDAANVFVGGGAIDPFILYRRGAQWQPLPLPPDSKTIWDVCGQSAHEVYFVGDDGQILLWDGRQVSRLPTPTTRHLVSVERLNEQYMCASGYDGTLLIGNSKGWRLVPTNTETDLLSITEWDGKIYYGADDAVWSFDGRSAPALAIEAPARVLSGLGDGLAFSMFIEAHLYSKGKLVDLDSTIP